MTQQTIHLQGLGTVNAVRAEELRPGMRLAWNYSYGQYEVVAIEPLTERFVCLVSREVATGKAYRRKVGKSRLVGIVT